MEKKQEPPKLFKLLAIFLTIIAILFIILLLFGFPLFLSYIIVDRLNIFLLSSIFKIKAILIVCDILIGGVIFVSYEWILYIILKKSGMREFLKENEGEKK